MLQLCKQKMKKVRKKGVRRLPPIFRCPSANVLVGKACVRNHTTTRDVTEAVQSAPSQTQSTVLY